MRSRLLLAGLAVPCAALLASCASSGTVAGQGTHNSGGTTPSASSPATGSSVPASPAPASSSANPSVTLAARLAQGLTAAKTAHIALQFSASGQVINGSGDEMLSGGKLVSLNLSESVGSSVHISIVIVGGKTYVKLPATLNKSGKPWQLVRAGSSSAVIRNLASSLASTQSSASLSSITELVSAARTVTQSGTGSMNGSPTVTYRLDVDPAKLPSTFNGRAALIAGGITSIPLQITVDSQGRPVQVVENFTASGQAVRVKIDVSNYNKPVHITAPPAKQVSTK